MATFSRKPLAPLLADNEEKIVLIKLNTPIESHIECFRSLWNKAVLRAFVDGAVNDLHGYVLDNGDLEFLPDLVTGDFDSARPGVLQDYRQRGVEIINTPDQDDTDFTKCFRIVSNRISSQNLQVSCVVAFVSFSGRLDHVLGNLNTLFLAATVTSLPLYLISGDNLAFLLSPGSHALAVGTGMEEGTCALVPLGHPARHVSTRGLKWNLKDNLLEFGGLVSTSNQIADDTVTIETDAPLLWTMSIKAKLDS